MTHPVPIEAILDDRLGIVGGTGSGKTYSAGTMVELLLQRGERTVIVDPLGAWWGLRLDRHGKQSQFDLPIFGGKHGDLPLVEGSGKVIGETVAGMQQSCILDLSQIGTKAAERRFMLPFLTALYSKQKDSLLHTVFDEADMWAPQVLLDKDGDAAKLLGMMETIVRRGRIRGFVPWMITQRPAVLSKNVLSQVDGVISFKLTSSQDRDALSAWVEGQADKAEWKQTRSELAGLDRGTGLIWLPSRNIMKQATFPEKTTYDSSRAPKRGEVREAVVLKPLDLDDLKSKLQSIETEAKTNDPKALKAEIARLKVESQNQVGAATDAQTEKAFKSGFENGLKEGYERGVSDIGRVLTAHIPVVIRANLEAAQKAPLHIFAQSFKDTETRTAEVAHQPSAPATTGRDSSPANVASPRTEQNLPPIVRKIINCIHEAYPRSVSFDAAARRAGVSKRSSAYRSYRNQVVECVEVVQSDDGKFRSQPAYIYADRKVAGAGIDAWTSKLPPSIGKMLMAIADGHSDKAAIAEAAGISPTSSGLGSGLRELVELELVVVDGGNYTLAEGL